MTNEPALNRLRSLPKGPERAPLLEYIRSFKNPESVAREIIELLNSDDPLVSPKESFFKSPSSNLYEEWNNPVNAKSIHEVNKGRLLCLPPGSNRFQQYREIIPSIIEDQLEKNFPGLKGELANRPNLFFHGVFYPDEISIANMEMISLHHGRNYVVKSDLKLEGIDKTRTIVLKPTSMGVESGITSLLDEMNRRMSPDLRGRIGDIQAPAIISVEDTYGILEYLPGKNGVEILPRGINTGSIHALKSNEHPKDLQVSEDGLINIIDEFAKQSALAFYLRIYDRKPDQLMFESHQNGNYTISHIDFGRGLKKNFALPWKRYYATQRAPLEFDDYQIPYFESAASLIFLTHFIPHRFKNKYRLKDGILRRRLKRTFVELGHFFKRNAETIREYLESIIGQETQFNDSEVNNLKVTSEDIREIDKCLHSFDPTPENVCESVINLAIRERAGGAPTENLEENNDDTIYSRGIRSGNPSRKLIDEPDGDHAYELKNYKHGGNVYYDLENQVLRINFGTSPQTVIDYVYWHYAPSLAEFFETFSSIEPDTRAVVQLDGESKITVPPGMVRRDIQFPVEALQEVRRSARGFADPEHLQNHIQTFNEWIDNNPDASFQQKENLRQKFIFRLNMDGKDILQWYEQTTANEETVGKALNEIINHLLSNPEYLSDKDPLKSINDLVVNLGHKYEFISPLKYDNFTVETEVSELFERTIEFYNEELPIGHFDNESPQHLSHIKILFGISDYLITNLNLSKEQNLLLQSSIILHNLGIQNEKFASLLMNPNDRLERPIYQNLLTKHSEFSLNTFQKLLRNEKIPAPPVDLDKLKHLLKNHHAYWKKDCQIPNKEDRVLYEILHLADNLAVFNDRTRPDHWSKGYLPLTESAPRWINTQFEKGIISEQVKTSTERWLAEKPDSFEKLNKESRRFIELHNALQLGNLLEDGINPQNPHMVREMQKRHGERLIQGLWDQVIDSNLPVEEKVKILRRLDELAPLFTDSKPADFNFLNASPKPAQRTVDQIKKSINNHKKVILFGVFPRVTKAFERFMETTEEQEDNVYQNVLAIAGKRRLQFIRHSYPFEAEFEQPFHKIIQNYRRSKSLEKELCFIPFINFYQGYSPVEDPASRVRNLEKASPVEEHSPSEQVLSEATRFNQWRESDYTLDKLENERLNRIVLNNFSNREVIYFYRKTLRKYQQTEEPLKEVIGALWENPNYLSERTSRYSIHELVRSLSQIHFFEESDQRNYKFSHLAENNNSNLSDALNLISQKLGSELGFFQETLDRAGKIFKLLDNTGQFRICEKYLLATAGLVGTNATWRDYLLSPEDISYNHILRNRLLDEQTDLTEKSVSGGHFNCLDSEVQQSLQELMDPPLDFRFGLIQASLYLSLCIDFSRVENWERGHRRIEQRDLNHFLNHFRNQLSSAFNEEMIGEILETIKTTENFLDNLNQLASETYSYIYLFNALIFTSELRYGLFPGAVNSLDNARELYGIERVNSLMSGIIESDLSALESLKLIRKIRYFSSAIERCNQNFRELYILKLDRSGTWSLPSQHQTEDASFVLSGKLSRVMNSWQKLQNSDRSIAEKCYCLIGEEFPLLLKETTVSRTEELRTAVSKLRDENDLNGQYLLVPARKLFNKLPQTQETGQALKLNDPHSLYLKSWLSLFGSNTG